MAPDVLETGDFMRGPIADGRVPSLVVDYDGNWIRVDLTADVDAWAQTEVRLRLEAGGLEVKPPVPRGAGHCLPQHNVVELLTYAWVFPGYPKAVALTTAFTDLVEAGQWRPAVDALASGVALDPVAG